MPSEKMTKLLEKSKKLAEAGHRQRHSVCGRVYGESPFIYEDSEVRIIWMPSTQDLEIVWRKSSDGKIENPVVMVVHGEVIRTHGETSYAAEHIEKL